MKLTHKRSDDRWYCAHSKPQIIRLTKSWIICDIYGFSLHVVDTFLILSLYRVMLVRNEHL